MRPKVPVLFWLTAWCFTGCSEDSPAVPEKLGGAVLEVTVPEAAGDLPWFRIGLWHRNRVPPPECASVSMSFARLVPFAAEPLCTRMTVIIRDLTGEPVLSVADTVSVGGALSFPWDGRNWAGETVPSGYYPMFAECLDSRGRYTLTGHYFWWNDADAGVCRWPLWSRETGPVSGGEILRFGAFPDSLGTLTFDSVGAIKDVVTFTNPFTVRIEAPGTAPYEQDVVLEAERVTSVSWPWTPAP